MTPLLIVNMILFTLSIAVVCPMVIFTVECLAAVLFHRKWNANAKDGEEGREPRTVVVIPAHNEQLVIEETLRCIFSSLGDAAWVLVVADNCTDRTAQLAEGAGAEVLVRQDPQRRGKGYALQAAIEYLHNEPPEVMVVIDADCHPRPQTIETLARAACHARRPVQALNLTDRYPAAGAFEAVSILGNRFTNMIRPLGLLRLGLPCRLMGTGMAIPWKLIEQAPLPGESLVEDMQWGIDFALRGHFPLFCPEARVASGLPPADAAFLSQRTRWDHGHLRTAMAQIPKLLIAAFFGICLDNEAADGLVWPIPRPRVGRPRFIGRANLNRRRHWSLLGVALDLSIPPLTLLVALWLGAAIFAMTAWWCGASAVPAAILAGGGLALGVALGLGWARFCREQVAPRAMAAVPIYVLRKMPIYARLVFHGERAWVRTERDRKVSSR